MTRVQAVTFDAGGTLIEPWPSVGAVYAEVAARFGISCRPETLTSQFASAWRARNHFDYSRSHWFEVVTHAFTGTADVSHELFEAIYQRFSEPSAWLIYDDVIPALQQLERAGIRLAIISNWDERLPPLLDQLGLTTYFEEIVFSTAVGAHKPDPRIFQHAADRLQVRPEAILHIGDNQTEDVKGGQSAGLNAFRIRRSGRTMSTDIENLTTIPRLIDKLSHRKASG
jgi:putative hydrolase of the HAD superfamily